MPKYKKIYHKRIDDLDIIPSSGNIFLDLGFPEDEAETLMTRSKFMIEIEKIIESNGWTQAEAARQLGVSQPRVSDLIHGRVDKFSIDMLMRWLVKLGRKVTYQIKSKKEIA